jgi:hypothetical protein
MERMKNGPEPVEPAKEVDEEEYFEPLLSLKSLALKRGFIFWKDEIDNVDDDGVRDTRQTRSRWRRWLRITA